MSVLGVQVIITQVNNGWTVQAHVPVNAQAFTQETYVFSSHLEVVKHLASRMVPDSVVEVVASIDKADQSSDQRP